MNNRTILIALHHLEGIGWKTIERVVNYFPNLTDTLMLEASDWQDIGIPASRALPLSRMLRALDPSRVEHMLSPYDRQGIGTITIYDQTYPELLKQTAQPPWVLYTRGRVEHMQKPCIAVVGTRTPTAYGRQSAEQLSASLSAAGVCIVSGLARGIDRAAHEGSLPYPGGTIAVLGCSIDQIYPPENKLLYQRMMKEALVVSEYPIGTQSHPGLFPQRNRIIAGLSMGVLVIEAAMRSGSFITVDHALSESRDIYAIPGQISSPKSQGALSLIKQGAKMVTCAADLLEEYPHIIPSAATHQKAAIAAYQTRELTADEQCIVHLLQDEPQSIEELLVRSQFTFGHLHTVLLNLLMIKRVEQLPGSVYVLR